MEQKSTTEEAKPRVDKDLFQKPASPTGFFPWLVASFVFSLVSLISIIYYIFGKRSKPKTRQEDLNAPIPPVQMQAEKTDMLRMEEMGQDRIISRFLLSLTALLLGVAGQFMLRTERPLPIGAILIALSALFFVIAFWRQPGSGIRLNTETWILKSPTLGQPRWIGVIALGLSILLAGLAFWLFGGVVPSIYPWILHLVSIGLLIFSGFWFNKCKALSKVEGNEENNKEWTWLEAGIFLVIMAIAAFMRLYRFDQVPFGLWYDEADNGLVALNILNSPDYLPVFATTLPAHLFYLIALSFKILGVSTLAIRAVSVVFGMATIVVSFFLGNELFNRRMGLVLAFFLAVSRWDVNWSRIGMHAVSVPFFEMLSVLLLLRALRRQSLLDYSLTGLSLGLGLCFYTPLYILPVVIGIFLLFLWLNRHNLVSSSWRGFLLLALGFVVASVPISQFAMRQPESFSGRVNVTSIFTGKTRQEGWQAVAKTTREHLLMFHYHGDNNGRHNLPGEPMLDPISGTFMILGVALSLWRIRQPLSFLLITWLLIMLVPGIFSLDFESPQSLRAIGSMPAAYLLCVVPIHALWQEWDKLFRKISPAVFVLPLMVVLLAIGAINHHIYFNLQAKNSNTWMSFSTPETIIGKMMAELGQQADYYVSVFYHNSPTLIFLAPEITGSIPLKTYDTLPVLMDGRRKVVFFVDLDRKPFFLQAQRYYPNADFKEYKDMDGTTILYQITLNPSDINASQGITASYYRNANWSEPPFLVTTEKTIDMDWKDGDPANFPFGVKLQGVLFAERYGVYRLTLHSPSPSELTLDDVEIDLTESGEGVQTVEVELAKGCHDLIIKTMGKEGHIELDWQPPGEERVLIPSSHLLLPPISNNGLLGYYFANGDWQAPPAFTQVDPWILFTYHIQPLPRPYTVEWVGRINISKGGSYRFDLESIDESALFIDEVQIISEMDPNEQKEGEINLSPGFHQIRLRYADRTGYSHINLYWTPPNSEREVIPQEVLFLP